MFLVYRSVFVTVFLYVIYSVKTCFVNEPAENVSSVTVLAGLRARMPARSRGYEKPPPRNAAPRLRPVWNCSPADRPTREHAGRSRESAGAAAVLDGMPRVTNACGLHLSDFGLLCA